MVSHLKPNMAEKRDRAKIPLCRLQRWQPSNLYCKQQCNVARRIQLQFGHRRSSDRLHQHRDQEAPKASRAPGPATRRHGRID